jgi:opacity protein-like surface antigen
MQSPAAVLAVALALLSAPAARAQPVSARSGPDTYLVLSLGAFLPQSSDLDQLDPGIALSGTFGAMFSPYLGAEATLGYYRTAGTVPTLVTDLDRALGVVPVLVSLRLVAPFKAMELSLRAGGGVHFASRYDTALLYSDYATSTAFGWQVGAGAAFKLSPTMLVGVDVLGTFAEATFDGAATGLDGVTVAATLGYRF